MTLNDPDRILAATYAKKDARPRTKALFLLDERLGQCLILARDPLLAQIRLTWWHEGLSAMNRAVQSADPLLIALHKYVSDGEIDVTLLTQMVDGWMILLGDFPLSDADLLQHATLRGGSLFAAIAGKPRHDVNDAGALWALMDVSYRVSDAVTRERAMALSTPFATQGLARQISHQNRPLAILTRFSERDCMNQRAGSKTPNRIAQIIGLYLGRR